MTDIGPLLLMPSPSSTMCANKTQHPLLNVPHFAGSLLVHSDDHIGATKVCVN